MQQMMYSFIGHWPPTAFVEAVRQGAATSFCLFNGLNMETPAQLRELTDILHAAARQGGQLPPLLGIDQEGGQLIAVAGGATELPGNMALGATRSPELAEQAGRVLGRELRAMGINMNFAPSVDVNVNPENPVVGIRSFGADPEMVGLLGSAMIRGIQSEGVIATAKHFPGHGDSQGDSHYTMPAINHSLERITAVELAPFRQAIEAGVKSVMTAHILFKELDQKLPATLSPAVLDGYLRQKMGFAGLTITDAMDMHAVAQFGAFESVCLALQAGADLVLLGHLLNQLELGQQVQPLLRPDAIARIQALRQWVFTDQPVLDVVGCAEHQRIAQTIADRSITLVKDNGKLPLRPGPADTIAVITPPPVNLTPADTSARTRIGLVDAIRRRHPRILPLELQTLATGGEIQALAQAASQAQIVVVGTIVADQDKRQAELVRAIQAAGQSVIVVSLRTPYDLNVFPDIDTYLCAYGIRAATTEAIAKVLFGEIEAVGILPCPVET